MIGAAVDVGSNSVHLLVARVDEDGLSTIDDESELIGLGDVVDAYGAIPPESIEILAHSLTVYRDRARSLGATSVTFLGTEPLRVARNGADVAQEVEAQTGIPLRILSRREEGELTFVGVTGGRRVDEPLLVADIGGGSTEVVHYEPTTGLTVTGLHVGSARLWRDYVKNDPPTDTEIAELRRQARKAIQELPAAGAARAIFVGGTATNLVRLEPLAMTSFTRLYATLQASSASAIAERYVVRLRRAHQLAPGAAIAEALLAHYRLESAEVTEASLRDGAIVQAADRNSAVLG